MPQGSRFGATHFIACKPVLWNYIHPYNAINHTNSYTPQFYTNTHTVGTDRIIWSADTRGENLIKEHTRIAWAKLYVLHLFMLDLLCNFRQFNESTLFPKRNAGVIHLFFMLTLRHWPWPRVMSILWIVFRTLLPTRLQYQSYALLNGWHPYPYGSYPLGTKHLTTVVTTLVVNVE